MPKVAMGTNRTRLLASFAAVYIIWGSTYLAISYAEATIPPLLMAGGRFLIAGGLLYGWVRLRGGTRPAWSHWRSAAIIGVLMLAGGNGGVVIAERTIPTGLAALLISTVPVWMVLIEGLRPGGRRPTLPVAAGLGIGFVGVALLVGPRAFAGGIGGLGGMLVVVGGALCWAIGSLYSRTATLSHSPLMGNALEMLTGGALLMLIALLTGEGGQLHFDQITLRSALALAFLVVFGSLIAFTAYVWLLRHVSVARVSTYAYVNPVVALLLGFAFNGERPTPLTLLAAAVILAAVVVITTFRERPDRRTAAPPATPEAASLQPASRKG